LVRFARRPDEAQSRLIEVFTRDELTLLLGTAEQEMPDHYPLILTLARTGLRIGEVLTLKPDDRDFFQHALWVRRTWARELRALGDRQIGTPKSGQHTARGHEPAA
jgi:integrase